jgi:hypothetical protein
LSDPRSQGADKPLLKPVGVGSLVRTAASERPALKTESFLLFAPFLDLEDLDAGLCTTGFDAAEIPAQVVEPPAPEPAAPIEVAIPVSRPILEVRPTTTPIAVYEPIEFLEYDDEDDSFAAIEPESEPPVLTEFAHGPELKPVGLPPAKAEAGFSSLALPDVSIEIPDLSLQTLRRKILPGPNPFAAKPVPVPEVKPQVQVRPAPSPVPQKHDRDKRQAKTTPPQPTRPMRDRGNAVPVEEVIPEAPAPLPKPKMVPIRKPEPLAPAAAAVDVPMLGLPQENANRSRFAMVAAALVTLGVGGFFVFSGEKTSAAGSAESVTSTAMPGLVLGGGGWTTTWGADTPTNRGKQISIYRPSMTMPDYRFEFRGQIERKALGWIFRASNPKNYYVMKLETIKPGPNPLVALVKYAVIEGKESTHTQVMLPFDVKADTVYQVRLDVSGDKFTTYVQSKLVDYWTDNRVKLGGTGFYTETGERSQIKSSQISYLR